MNETAESNDHKKLSQSIEFSANDLQIEVSGVVVCPK